jgi:hypothetical protein
VPLSRTALQVYHPASSSHGDLGAEQVDSSNIARMEYQTRALKLQRIDGITDLPCWLQCQCVAAGVRHSQIGCMHKQLMLQLPHAVCQRIPVHMMGWCAGVPHLSYSC